MSDGNDVLSDARLIFIEKYRGKCKCQYGCTHRAKYRLQGVHSKFFACTKHLDRLEERADIERAKIVHGVVGGKERGTE